MGITETVTRVIAEADYTDDCMVLLRTREKLTTLTAEDADELARDLMQAASNAREAATSAIRAVEPAAFDVIGAGDTA